MFLYDTLSKTKKELKPISDNKIGIFVCGPTVYDYSHIGHARTYIAFDAFVRYLRFKKFDVRYIQNITNIEDKIIERANELNENPLTYADTFEKEYYHDMESLGITSPDKYARATDYIPQIMDQISRLFEKGYAYKAEDGVYYDISKFKDYGKLSGRTVEQAEDAVSRIDESVNKRNRGDFSLWKFKKPGEPSWPSPWGDGRPGWHIEDTAITEAELGEQYDLHGGGRDLIFPHHESEIAQMEAVSGKEPLANYWMHTGFLTINGQKMSKSLGNFIPIQKLLQKYSKETFRLFVLSSHYKSPIDYRESAMEQANANATRLGEFFANVGKISGSHEDEAPGSESARRYIKSFYAELDNDFNTPKALAILFELVRDVNNSIHDKGLGQNDAKPIKKLLDDVNSIFDIIPKKTLAQIPEEVLKLVNEREQLRRQKRWDEADEIRDKLANKGYSIEDAENGPNIKQI